MRALGRAFARATCVVVAVSGCQACSRPVRASRLIDVYSGAACIPPKLGTGAEPERQWDSTLRLADGRSVVVSAFQAPSGAVRVHYTDSGSDIVAADAGEYVYPSDIRWDPAKGSLYVKAHGVPVPWDKGETDLFEFDLPSKRHGQHEVVDPTVLPAECEGRE